MSNIFYFKNFHLLDGTKDMKDHLVNYLEVTDGIITGIGDLEVKENTKVYDLNGAYLMPGLINLHVHLPASGKVSKKKLGDKSKLVSLIKSNALFRKIGLGICKSSAITELKSGVTTLRAVGGVGNLDSTLKNMIENGKTLGPRILASNEAVAPIGGHMAGTVAQAVTSIEEGKQKIHELKEEGVDLIKLMITGGVLDSEEVGHPGVLKMSEEYVKAFCDEAHSLNLSVAAHIESKEGVRVGVLNGVDTVEHGSSLTDDLVKIMKERNAKYICTLSPAIPLAYVDPEVIGYGEAGQINGKVLLDEMILGVKTCLENGIQVGLGNDTGCPYVTHYCFYRELDYFKKMIGIDSTFTLYTATLNNAQILGIDNITGSVELNKQADLLIVKDNPLDDFNNLASPLYVVKGNNVLKNPKNKKFKNVEDTLNNILN